MHEWPTGLRVRGTARAVVLRRAKTWGGGPLDLMPMCESTHIQVWREISDFSGRLSSSFNLILVHIQASAQGLHVHTCVNARARVPLQVLVEGVC